MQMHKTNGWLSINTKYVTAVSPKATIGNTAQIKLRKVAKAVATHIIQTWEVYLSGKHQLIPMPIDSWALNVSSAFRDTRCSIIHLAARALFELAIQSLVDQLKDLPLSTTILLTHSQIP